MDSGANVVSQALDDAAQSRLATFVQMSEKLILIFVYTRRSGFNVSQVDVILLRRQ